MPETRSRDEAQHELDDERSRWENDNWLRPNARPWDRYYVESVLKLDYDAFIAKLAENDLTFDEFFIRARVEPESLLSIDLDDVSAVTKE